jgi:thiamine monophosphate kinase
VPSEFELITRFFSRPVPGDMVGAGDDCALFTVKPGMQLATSTDTKTVQALLGSTYHQIAEDRNATINKKPTKYPAHFSARLTIKGFACNA